MVQLGFSAEIYTNQFIDTHDHETGLKERLSDNYRTVQVGDMLALRDRDSARTSCNTLIQNPADYIFPTEARDSSLSPINLPPEMRQNTIGESFSAVQEWQGYVVEIGKTEILARLTDVTGGSLYEGEVATIPLDEISDNDQEKMETGSIFRWVIGFQRSPLGTKKRVSLIVFRDLPAMRNVDFEQGQRWADRMFQSLNP